MTEDIEIFQDLCDTFGIHGTLKLPVDIRTFAAGAGGLRDLGKDPASPLRQSSTVSWGLFTTIRTSSFR